MSEEQGFLDLLPTDTTNPCTDGSGNAYLRVVRFERNADGGSLLFWDVLPDGKILHAYPRVEARYGDFKDWLPPDQREHPAEYWAGFEDLELAASAGKPTLLIGDFQPFPSPQGYGQDLQRMLEDPEFRRQIRERMKGDQADADHS
jgi:hypothetical protein